MSNLLKKSFAIYMIVMMVAFGVLTVGVNVKAAAVAGDLVKSTSSSAVYYIGSDLKKHPFGHARDFYTWYPNFSSIKTISTDEMAAFGLPGSSIVVRPSRLVQFVEVLADGTWSVANSPQVYAVSTNGSIQHITSAAVAASAFGSDWEKKIVPVVTTAASNYTVGPDFTGATYPSGTLVKTAAAAQVYYIDGATKRAITDAGFTANRFNMKDVFTAASLDSYVAGTSIVAVETAVANPIAGVAVPVAPVSGSGLTVALAADNPGANVAPLSATSVPLMKFTLTASSDGPITVNTLSVKRFGVGASSDFNYLYLYDGATRLTNGKTLNSTTNVAQFVNIGLVVPAGTTKTLTLSADIATCTTTTACAAGDYSYFQILATDITATGTVNGSFPLSSSTVTLGSQSAGTIKVEKDGTLSNPSVGQLNSRIAQFKLTAGTGEDLTISRISLYEGGTLNNAYLANLKLYQNTTLLASVASVNDKGYVVFNLATPYTLTKNTNRVFYVTADLGGSARNSDTIITYVDQTTDVYAIGASYGFGATVDIGATAGTYDGSATGTKYSTVTVQGGQITVAMNGPITGNLAVGSTGVSLLNFSVTSAVNAEIRTMRIELHNSGTDLNKLDTDMAADYIANVKVVDTDNGESTSAVNSSTFTSIGTNAGIYTTYTDYFTLTAGKTRNFAVKADLNASLTAGTYYAILGSSKTTFYTFSSTAIKNTDNNQYATDIVPSTFSQGNNQTVAAAGLYVSLASNQVGTTVIEGTQKVDMVEFALQALSGSSVTISGMTLYGYVDANGIGTSASGTLTVGSDALAREAGMSAVGTVYANNLVTNFRIYDKTADPTMATNLNTSVESMNTLGAVTFSNMNWTIPAGTTHILAVVADVTSSAFENGDTGGEGTLGMAKYVKMNFADKTAITAVDASSNSVTMAAGTYTVADGNGSATAVTSSAYINISNQGSLNVTAESNPAAANVVAGTSNVPVLNLKFQSTNEAFNVNKLRISEAQGYSRAVSSATISYQNQAGQTVTATQQLINGIGDFNITANPLYVPSGASRLVNVYFNLTAINQTYAAYTGDTIKAKFVAATYFEAKGAGSSRTSLTYPGTSAVDVTGSIMIVHGTVPTFTVDTTTNTTLQNGPVELYRFQVAAAEGTDVNLKKLSFKLSMTDSVISAGNATLTLTNFEVLEGSSYATVAALTQADTGTNSYAVYNGWGATGTVATGVTGGLLSNASGKVVQNINVAGNGNGVLGASASSTRDVIVVFNDDRLISSGQSKYYILRASASNVDLGASSNDSMGMYMFDGDTASSSANTYLEASCANPAAPSLPKYCLSDDGSGGEVAAWMIWSDSTGISGNNAHQDTNASVTTTYKYDGVTVTPSNDWFNGYKIKTLNTQRSLN
ncbi:MAG: hypothetical protein NTZ18_01275 [Candidatus Komeilibacteria bacterium]|nr:hypothetical protein [Candidatus Komeilibacteria bacterium]